VTLSGAYPPVMRKPNPEAIYQARRAAHFRRLASVHRLDELDAEHWLTRWEREAETRGLDRHSDAWWQDSEQWIAEQRGRI
jgi:hypothetical protein